MAIERSDFIEFTEHHMYTYNIAVDDASTARIQSII